MDYGSASIAKITRPVVTGSYPRPRLFRLIDRALKNPCLWVCGPAGSGKTTLVSGYLADRRLRGLWIRLEEGDADPATFFHYLAMAAQTQMPRARNPLPAFRLEEGLAAGVFSQRFFEALFARLRPGSLIVLDDYHRIPKDSVLHALIRDAVGMLPAGVRAIVVSRSQPPAPFARLRAGGTLGVIGWKDLRFTARETEGIARTRWKGRRGRAGIRSLYRICDGWAAGCVLLLERSPPTDAARKLPRHGTQEIFDYFASEIFDSLDVEVQSFLLKSAFLPRMTAKMAADLTGLPRAGTILHHLNRNNQFTEMRTESDPVYEYHPLFRDFLISRASDTYPEKYLHRLRGTAACILEAAGHPEEAADYLREIGDWRGFARILIRQAPALAAQGRLQTLGGWVEAVPGNFIGRDPWLLYWSGVASLPSAPADSGRDFSEAFRQFSRRKDRNGALLSWAGAVEAIVYGSGSLKALDPWFSALEGPWRNADPPPPEEVDARVTGAMIKALSLRRPPSVDMEAWADRAMRLAQSSRDAALQFSSLLNLAYLRFHGGDFPATGLLIDTLREMAGRPELSPLGRLNLCWLEAAYANANGRHDHGLKVVTEGMALAEATGVHLMDILLAGHGALSCLHNGDVRAAKGFLRRMAPAVAAARPWEAAFYYYLSAWVSLHGREAAQAAALSERGLATCREVGNPWTEALACLQRFFVLLEADDPRGARRHLERARRIGKESGMRFIRFAALLAEAYAALRRGDEASALPLLAEGLQMGRDQGYFDIYVWRPGLLEKIATKALEKGIEPEYVRELVRRNDLVPGDVLAEPEHWPWPIKIRALGTFTLLKDDQPLGFSRKEQRKPLMMLKTLVALGGKEVPQERLTDILWPDAEGDMAHQSFATTLGRLRGLLGNEQALSLRGGRLTLDPRYCWVDVIAFESLLARVDEAASSRITPPGGGEVLALGGRAVSLYRGSFLQGETGHPGITTTRERLRSKFLRLVILLGRTMEKEGQWAEAVACYRKGLEVDDLAEELYQRLMICHHRAGQPAEALAVYRRCEQALHSELRIAPSRETVSIARGMLPS